MPAKAGIQGERLERGPGPQLARRLREGDDPITQQSGFRGWGEFGMAGETADANAGQRRYWNEVAGPRWVAAPGFRERRNQESLALLLARLGLVGGESVLEIGCGTGALTLPLAAAVGDHGSIVSNDNS
jgi:2-polyprenyl-3-methyl-5-hydroxy-6-metoxy-1,4-benzoquinol methylase